MIQEKLDLIETSVDGVRSAITEKGGVYEGNISTLPDAIRSIPTGGDFDVKAFLEGTFTEFTVPNGVTYLRTNSFYSCFNLTRVTLPNSLTTLGDQCFYNCNALRDINIPSGVTQISALCFGSCYGLNLTLPDNITYIGMQAFLQDGNYDDTNTYRYMNNVLTGYNYQGNSEITIHEGIKFIDGDCFSWADGLQTVNLPESTTLIGAFAFNSAYDLVNINLENVQYFNEYCLSDCLSLLAPSDFPNVIAIDQGCFNGCSLPEQMHFGTELTYLSGCFQQCQNATNLSFSSEVRFTNNAFMATQVDSITWEEGVSIIRPLQDKRTTYYLPASTTTITNGYFNNSKVLFSKDLESVPVLDSIGSIPNVIVVPDNLVDAFKATYNWSIWRDVIKGWSEYEAEQA